MSTKQIIISVIILAVVGVTGFIGYKMYLKKKKEKEVTPADEDKNNYASETYEHKPAVVTNPIELDSTAEAEQQSTAVILDEQAVILDEQPIVTAEVIKLSSAEVKRQIPNIGRILI